jgi:urease accessory protein
MSTRTHLVSAAIADPAQGVASRAAVPGGTRADCAPCLNVAVELSGASVDPARSGATLDLTPFDAMLPRLLQLASPMLPVGAYAYSEGLEYAVQAGWVHHERSARDWIIGLLEHSLARLDVPLFARAHAAWLDADEHRARGVSAWLLASRETAELRAADRHQGQALARVLAQLGDTGADAWMRDADASFAALFARAAVRWQIPVQPAASALLWSWCENITVAAMKLVPLGQSAGQRLLFEAGSRIPALSVAGVTLEDDAIGGGAPGLAIASARHEQQHTRLFRS